MDKIKLIMLSIIILYSTLFSQEELYNVNTQCRITPKRITNVPRTINFEALELVDSVINKDDNFPKSKFTYFYNQDHRTVTEINYNWDETKWIFYGRATHTYDLNGNRTTYIIEFWEETEWIFYKRNTYTYDSNGNMTLRLFEKWDGSQWVNIFRFSYTYDSNGNMTLELGEEWDGTEWIYSSRYTYTYSPNGDVISYLEEYWDGTEWIWDYMEEYIYDSNWNLSNVSKKKWNGSWWTSDGKITYEYDSNGNVLSILYEDVFYGTVNYLRIMYSYDTNGNMLTQISEEWNGTDWIYIGQVTYTYDGNGNMITQLGEEWNGTDWVFKTRYTNSYNENGNVNLIVCELWDFDKWITSGSTPSLAMEDKYGNIFYCSGPIAEIFYTTLTDVKETLVQEFYILSQNYPNPFNPSTIIKYSIPKQSNVILKVFDVLGSEVATLVNQKQKPGNYEIEFDGSELTSGIYLYRIQAGDFVETRKMILLK